MGMMPVMRSESRCNEKKLPKADLELARGELLKRYEE
jgi:hypothetical protein